MATTKSADRETPAKQIIRAKEGCQRKLVEAIAEFENITGLRVNNVEFKRCPSKFDVTIVISL